MITNVIVFCRTIGLLLVTCAVGAVDAQPGAAKPSDRYPQKPIKIVVPYSPGTGPDLLARYLAERLSPKLGQPLVVESKPGASGLIGTNVVANAANDGHTLLIAPPTHIISSVLRKTPYDPVKDFEPVAQMARGGLALIVHPSNPAQNLEQLLVSLRAMGSNATYSSAGIGSTLHLYMAQFQLDFGTQMRHVPSKGAPGAVMDVVQNNVTVALASLELVSSLLKSGKLKALAQTGVTRSSVLPQTPTFAEAGFPAYNVELWFGLYAPAGTPAAVTIRLNKEVNAVMDSPDARQLLSNSGLDPVLAPPEQLGTLSRSEFSKWTSVVKRAGITAE